MREVARRAGVSLATVSYVVNSGPRPVSDELREPVLTAMRKARLPAEATRPPPPIAAACRLHRAGHDQHVLLACDWRCCASRVTCWSPARATAIARATELLAAFARLRVD